MSSVEIYAGFVRRKFSMSKKLSLILIIALLSGVLGTMFKIPHAKAATVRSFHFYGSAPSG
jgi:hypothetical protein